MAKLPIVTLPDPVLRRKARKVAEIDKDLQVLIDDMIETMRDAPGVGLAAPQVGKLIRLAVIEYGDEDDEGKPVGPKKLYVLINPEIAERSQEMELGIEGCLSVPGLVGEVERYQALTVKYTNRYGKAVKVKASGWLARIFQHEMDHLEGVMFTDIASQVWKPKEGEALPLD